MASLLQMTDITLTLNHCAVLHDLDFDCDVDVGEFTSKIYGRGTDQIRIRERLVLSGANACGLIRSCIAATDDAVAEIIGMTEGNAADARCHVDLNMSGILRQG